MSNNCLLIDFSPLKAGGGVQLALNFLDYISRSDEFSNAIVLISDKFPLVESIDKKFECIVFPSHPIKRIIAENFELKKIVKAKSITHIFTFFGPGLPNISSVRQIVSVAYPIICYDDSPYWNNVPSKVKALKKVYNKVRLSRISSADAVIVETTTMQKRLAARLNAPTNTFTVIPPVPTSYVKNVPFSPHQFTGRFLVLSGLAEHKNIWRLIEVAALIHQSDYDIKFIISVDKAFFTTTYQNILENYSPDILDCFEFKGSIPQGKIQEIYDSVDALINISDLESFSNNYMEAWLAAKPIIASDRDFAHDILKDSAVYVEPHDCQDVFNKLIHFSQHPEQLPNLVAAGKAQLEQLPNIEERWQKVKSVIFEGK